MFELSPLLFENLLYSIKCFAAAMLAIYLALKMGLPKPFWAMTTVYVVSAQPFSGIIRSRSFYRVIGTLIAAIAVVTGFPLFFNYRILFLIVIALWVGGCIYLSLMDRTPRSYIFRLAAYTAGIIAFPLLQSPDVMSASAPFDQALSRVEEIILGILCATVIHTAFFPRSIDKKLLSGLDNSLSEALQWLRGILTNQYLEKGRQRLKLSQDITASRLLATHVPYDPSTLRWHSRIINIFHDRLALLIMTGAEIGEYKKDMENFYPDLLSKHWQKMNDEIAGWIRNGPFTREKSEALHEEIRALTPSVDAASSWDQFLLLHYAVLLHKSVNIVTSSRHWRDRIEAERKNEKPGRKPSATFVSNTFLQTEKKLAFRTAMSAAMGALIGSVVWIMSGWQQGSGIPVYACLICCIFAMVDEPASYAKGAFKSILIMVPVCIFYLWTVLAYTNSFEMLCLVLAPFLLLMGYLTVHPAYGLRPSLMVAAFSGMLMTYDQSIPNASEIFNSQLAQLFGMGLGIVLITIFRRIDLEKMAYYLAEACWIENASIGHAAKPPSIHTLAVRMTDRISLIVSHLSSVKDRQRISSLHLIRDILTSMDMAELKRLEPFLHENKIPVEILLSTLSDHFRQKLDNPSHNPAPILAPLDTCLRQLAAMENSLPGNQAISTLVGIRIDLFPSVTFT